MIKRKYVWRDISELPKSVRRNELVLFSYRPEQPKNRNGYGHRRMYSLNSHAGSRVCDKFMIIDSITEATPEKK